MHRNLLGMWQNEEIRNLLLWLRNYNQHHTQKVQLTGMDYFCVFPSAALIPPQDDPQLNEMIAALKVRCKALDETYTHMDTYPRKELFDNGIKRI